MTASSSASVAENADPAPPTPPAAPPQPDGWRGLVDVRYAAAKSRVVSSVKQSVERYQRVRRAWPSTPVKLMARLTKYLPLDPELLMLSYAQGIFPMASPDGSMCWMAPDPRAVLVVSEAHVPSRIRRYLRNGGFEIRYDTAFRRVLEACADRSETWLSPRLIDALVRLHEMGAAHCVEAWQGDEVVGGGFGVAVGRVFTLDSLFSKVDQASKVAFVHLLDRLPGMGFELIDCQFLKDHFARFGAREIPLSEYRRHLARGLAKPGRFVAPG